MDKFEHAQAGDDVFSVRKGWGTVLWTNCLKLGVRFDDSQHDYYADGHWAIHDKYPELYWNEPWVKNRLGDTLQSWGIQGFDTIPDNRKASPEPEIKLTVGGKNVTLSSESVKAIREALNNG